MKKVAIIAFEGISLFHLSVPIATFSDAVFSTEKLFDVYVCSETKGQISSANGIGIDIKYDLSVIQQADIVIVPSWVPNKMPSPHLVEQLIDANINNKLVVGLCLGAYALAYSGLLNEKSATTHWKYGKDFTTRFPLITCDINPLYIVEGNIITSAGSAAAIDCCLHIVKYFYVAKLRTPLQE